MLPPDWSLNRRLHAIIRLYAIKIKILGLSRQIANRMSVSGHCPQYRMIDHQLTIVVEIMVHADLKEGKQAKADFTHDFPAALVHNFLNLRKVLVK